jgi:hypothetical protein
MRRRKLRLNTAINPFQPPAYVRDSGTGSAAPGSTVAITVPAGGHALGNLLVVAATRASNAVSSVTDSRGNTYVACGNATSGSNNIEQWASILTTALQAGDTITVTYTGSTTTVAAGVEFAHVAASSFVDGTPSTQTGSTSPIDAGAQTTTLTYDLLIATWALGSGSVGTYTPDAGWTAMANQPNVASARYLLWQYRVLAAAGAVTPSATITTPRAYAGLAVAYKQG